MTAFEIPGQRIPLVADVDLTGKRYKALIVNAAGNVVLAGANAVSCGACQREAVLGEATSVMINGVTLAYFGGTVNAGDSVSTDLNGNYIKAVAGPIVGVCVFGGVNLGLGSILLK